jgi:PAS domain S-box-containing protein
MNSKVGGWRSISTRMTVTVLLIFVVSTAAVGIVVELLLREGLERLASEQQMASLSLVARQLDETTENRIRALQDLAAELAPAQVESAAAVERALERLALPRSLFNAGIFVSGMDGTTLADYPSSMARKGINYMDRENVRGALKEGRTFISEPVMGRILGVPLIGMSVPILQPGGQVIGALTGLIDLSKPNYMGRVADGRYGKTGGYALVDVRHRVVISSSDHSRDLERFTVTGRFPLFARFVNGFEGTGRSLNPQGIEMLYSARQVPVAGWMVIAWLPVDEAFALVGEMQRPMLLVAIALTLLACLLCWWTIRRMLMPLKSTADHLVAMSGGDHPPTALPVLAQDEVGVMVGSFNQLLDSMGEQSRELAASERRFRALIEWSPVATVVHRAGKIVYVNPAACRMMGAASMDELVGQSIRDRVHPDSRESVGVRVRSIEETGRPTPMVQSRYLRLNGEPIDVEARGMPMEFDGELAICVTIHDVTERNRLQALQRVAAIAFEGQEALIVMDRDWRVLQTNQAFSDLTGLAAGEIGRFPMDMKLAPQGVHDTDEQVRQAVANTGSWRRDLWIVGFGGKEILVRASVTVVKDDAGVVANMVASLTDITTRHEAETQRLNHEIALRNLLVQEVHHRIKNNLQGLNGLLGAWADANPELAEPVNHALSQLQGVSVIYGLRGREGGGDVYLCEMLRAIAREVQSLWRSSIEVVLSEGFAPCLLPETEAVPMALVLNELLVNAVKHGGVDAIVKVEVKWAPQPGRVRVTIVNGMIGDPGPARLDQPHSGLRLVAALLPREGASLTNEMRGAEMLVTLDLWPPAIVLPAAVA